MRLRHIEVFNAIMLTGSVSAAARLINITQPAVSRTLQHAELQLGFPLFQRAKGRLTPTTEALTLYPHIERLFAQLDEVQRLASNLRTAGDTGELRILSVLALSYDILPRALKAFREKHPGYAITVESLHSPQIMSALLLQEADVGFAFSPAVHPSLTQETLADSRMVTKTSHYTATQLERLAHLAKTVKRNEATLLREALDDLFKKYNDRLHPPPRE